VTGPAELLRAGLLDGTGVLLASAPAGHRDAGSAAAVRTGCAELGASVVQLELGTELAGEAEDAAFERLVGEALAGGPAPAMLVVDAASLFGAAGGARAGLRACLELSWAVTRAVAAAAFLAQERGGRIVYLAPAAEAGEQAEAARAGLENLARTLSIEWARHGITTVAIAPGASTSSQELAALCAYLASVAGAYFSGCLLDLRGPAGASNQGM
jgi:NAD(P)-dependent dehydrogenase (short-subunit alcohol dehydrogenase family)